MTRAIFHPNDDGLLNYLVEDGSTIEPEYFMPVIPMVLVNGADGIGTGWSTSIPNYNPIDIVENIRRMMRGEELEQMNPWFRGFRGNIDRTEQDKYKISGVLEKIDDTTVEITELPIRKWTQDFKEMLEEMVTGDGKTPQTVKVGKGPTRLIAGLRGAPYRHYGPLQGPHDRQGHAGGRGGGSRKEVQVDDHHDYR
jgi:DNA topoisomerase-2